MSVKSANHKALPEFDVRPEHVADVIAAAMELPGVTHTVAISLGGWLVVRHNNLPDESSQRRKANFRAIIAALADDPRYAHIIML
ncbi:MAG: hypothetical protein ACR2MO_10025 [Acidimicrobiales bacterium]